MIDETSEDRGKKQATTNRSELTLFEIVFFLSGTDVRKTTLTDLSIVWDKRRTTKDTQWWEDFWKKHEREILPLAYLIKAIDGGLDTKGTLRCHYFGEENKYYSANEDNTLDTVIEYKDFFKWLKTESGIIFKEFFYSEFPFWKKPKREYPKDKASTIRNTRLEGAKEIEEENKQG